MVRVNGAIVVNIKLNPFHSHVISCSCAKCSYIKITAIKQQKTNKTRVLPLEKHYVIHADSGQELGHEGDGWMKVLRQLIWQR